MFDRAPCVLDGVAGPAPVVRPCTARYAGRTECFVSGIRAHMIANATHPTRATRIHQAIGWFSVLVLPSAFRSSVGCTTTIAGPKFWQGQDYSAESHIEMLLAPLPRPCGIVSVIDGHPATLAWLGSVRGHRVSTLGVEHFGQTGTIEDLYRHHGIDTDSIIEAAEALSPRRPVRLRRPTA
jgi:hypothetical protein